MQDEARQIAGTDIAGLIERLRAIPFVGFVDRGQEGTEDPSVCIEAATALEAQQKRIAELEEGIRPFAKAGEIAGERSPYSDFYVYHPAAGDDYAIFGDHIRHARALLNKGEAQKGKVA